MITNAQWPPPLYAGTRGSSYGERVVAPMSKAAKHAYARDLNAAFVAGWWGRMLIALGEAIKAPLEVREPLQWGRSAKPRGEVLKHWRD